MTLRLRILRYLTSLFIILVSLTRSLFNEKMLISNGCISGLMPKFIKKSWTVSTVPPTSLVPTALDKYYYSSAQWWDITLLYIRDFIHAACKKLIVFFQYNNCCSSVWSIVINWALSDNWNKVNGLSGDDKCVPKSAVHILLPRFYPNFIQILSRFFENSLYPNFILILFRFFQKSR